MVVLELRPPPLSAIGQIRKVTSREVV